jgi:hypothetical protein
MSQGIVALRGTYLLGAYSERRATAYISVHWMLGTDSCGNEDLSDEARRTDDGASWEIQRFDAAMSSTSLYLGAFLSSMEGWEASVQWGSPVNVHTDLQHLCLR